jgi:hypothetical protein
MTGATVTLERDRKPSGPTRSYPTSAVTQPRRQANHLEAPALRSVNYRRHQPRFRSAGGSPSAPIKIGLTNGSGGGGSGSAFSEPEVRRQSAVLRRRVPVRRY